MRVCQGLLKAFLIKSHHYCKYPPIAETGQKAEVPRIFPENVLFRPGSLHPLLTEGYHMQEDLGGQWTSRCLSPEAVTAAVVSTEPVQGVMFNLTSLAPSTVPTKYIT